MVRWVVGSIPHGAPIELVHVQARLKRGGGWGGGGAEAPPNNLVELGLRHTANVNLFPSIIQTRAIIDCKPSPET